MAKKDYAAELAELRGQMEKAEQMAAQAEAEAEQRRMCAEAEANKNRCLRAELESAKAEIMRVKAHAYDLMMEREAL